MQTCSMPHFEIQSVHNTKQVLGTSLCKGLAIADSVQAVAAVTVGQFDVSATSMSAIFEFVFSLPGFGWSYSCLSCLTPDFRNVLCDMFLSAGREIDLRLAGPKRAQARQ